MKAYQLVLAGTFLLAGTLILGCTDENIVNVPEEQIAQGISGRVIPPEKGATIAAWQASEIKQVTADDSGYFSISGLAPGLYELRVVTPSGAHRTISAVDVKLRETTALGIIQLANLPSPLLSVWPEDQADSVSPSADIRINSQTPMSLALLQSDVTITPPLSGVWYQGGNFGAYDYYFDAEDGLATATSYEVSIGPSLHSGTGLPPGTPVKFRFKTDSLRASWDPYYTIQNVSWNFQGTVGILRFNASVDPSSVSPGISIEPALPFSAQYSESDRRVNMILEGWPGTGNTYRIVVHNTIVDKAGKALAKPDTLRITSEAMSVEERMYPSSQSNVPPILTSDLLRIRYSVPIDKASARASISIDPPAPLDIEFPSYYYNDTLVDLVLVQAPEGLLPTTAYQITVAGTIASYDGKPFGAGESYSFQVQPLKISQFGFSSYPYNDADTVIAPGSMGELGLRFNANIDIDALNSATTIVPALPGFWYEGAASSPGVLILSFFPTASVDLPPEQTYAFTIDGSVGLVGGIGLGSNVVYRFHTEPVRIISLSPVPGAQVPNYYYPEVFIRFNSKMNRPSVEAAFTLTTFAGGAVTGTSAWNSDYEMRFNPTSSWIPGTSYKVDLNTTAQSASGAYLKEAGSTFFRAQ